MCALGRRPQKMPNRQSILAVRSRAAAFLVSAMPQAVTNWANTFPARISARSSSQEHQPRAPADPPTVAGLSPRPAFRVPPVALALMVVAMKSALRESSARREARAAKRVPAGTSVILGKVAVRSAPRDGCLHRVRGISKPRMQYLCSIMLTLAGLHQNKLRQYANELHCYSLTDGRSDFRALS